MIVRALGKIMVGLLPLATAAFAVACQASATPGPIVVDTTPVRDPAPVATQAVSQLDPKETPTSQPVPGETPTIAPAGPTPTAAPTYTPAPTVTPFPTRSPLATIAPTPRPAHTPTPEPATSGFPWERDGLTQDEDYALQYFQGLQDEHPGVAEVVRGFSWLNDGITREERSMLSILWGLAINDPSATERALELSWLPDGVTAEEVLALSELGSIAYYDVSVASAVMDFQWFSDGITEDENEVIIGFKSMVEEEAFDTAVIQRALNFPWLKENIDSRHGRVLGVTSFMGSHDAEMAIDILESDIFEDPLRLFSFSVVVRLRDLILSGLWQHIRLQPWFQDGLSDEDYVLIAAVNYLRSDSNHALDLLEGANIRSEIDVLPSGGKVKLVALSRLSASQVDYVFANMRTAVFEIEKFLRVPWQASTSWPHSYAGVFLDPIFSEAGLTYRAVPGALVPQRGSVIYHEMAHAYFSVTNFPKWVSEGTAEFLESYVRHVNEDLDLQSRYDITVQGCQIQGISNVQESIEFRAEAFAAGRGVRPNDDCAYTTGEAFMVGMYLSLGHDVTSTNLRALYMAGVANPERLTEDEIYRVLLASTPPDKQEAFRELYRRIHGGPIPN